MFQMLDKGNYDPPDMLRQPASPKRGKAWFFPAVLMSVSAVAVITWKRDLVMEKVLLLGDRCLGNLPWKP